MASPRTTGYQIAPESPLRQMPARPAITIRVRVNGSNWTSPTTWLVPPRSVAGDLGLAPDLPGRTTDRQPHATGVGRQWRPGGPAVHRTPDGRAVRADARRVRIEPEEHRLHPADDGRAHAGGVGPAVHPRQAALPDAGQHRRGRREIGRPHTGGAGGDVEAAVDDGQLLRHRRPGQQLPGRRGVVGVARAVDTAASGRSHRGVEHVRIDRIGSQTPHRLTGQTGRRPGHPGVRRSPHTVEDGAEPEPVPDRPVGDEQPADRAGVGRRSPRSRRTRRRSRRPRCSPSPTSRRRPWCGGPRPPTPWPAPCPRRPRPAPG